MYYPTHMPQIGQQGYVPSYPAQNFTSYNQPNTQGGIVCRPVTSRAEVEVAQIPFDGSTSWFYDTSTDRMYAKTFNPQDGTAPIATYIKERPAPPVQYATVDDIKTLREEIEQLKTRKAADDE